MYLSNTVYICLLSSVVCGQNTTIYRVVGNIHNVQGMTILNEWCSIATTYTWMNALHMKAILSKLKEYMESSYACAVGCN